MTPPTKVPEPGFYYHYKHNPEAEINNYAYEAIGVGVHTEIETETEEKFMVVYRPLYEASVYKAGKLFDIRPLTMWLSEVVVAGVTVPRFRKITDPKVLTTLEEIKRQLY